MNHFCRRSCGAGIPFGAGLLLAVLLTSSIGPARAATISHETFSTLLGRYVVDDRWVDYAAWKADESDHARLESYIEGLGAIDPAALDEKDRLAYWINAYNAVTVDLILDHYPVASIKDLGGVFSSPWKLPLFQRGDQELSLDAIENEILRPQFAEPRIHFAINCASVGCPPLAAEAYEGERIDEQLDAAVARVVHDPYWVDLSGCQAAYGSGKLVVSKLFDWFSGDFGGEAGVRNFLARSLPEQRFVLQNTQCSLEYRDYDWSLNAPPADEHSR